MSDADQETDAVAPSEWHEVESPDHIVEKYDPHPTMLYVRKDREVGVQVVPDTITKPSTGTVPYRVSLIRGNRDELEEIEELTRADDHEEALTRAREAMVLYDEVATGESVSERELELVEEQF